MLDAQLSLIKLSKFAAYTGQKTVLADQAVLVLCVHSPKISTAVLIVQATTCAGCLASFARTLAKN